MFGLKIRRVFSHFIVNEIFNTRMIKTCLKIERIAKLLNKKLFLTFFFSSLIILIQHPIKFLELVKLFTIKCILVFFFVLNIYFLTNSYKHNISS